ncbi:MAG: type III pantothenate kinase [Pseudomonadota bacterium]|nr:type III pantothenate kinase [Pseudomonadota bacterium]
MTTWLFDLGNSRLKLAPLLGDGDGDGDDVGEVTAIPHDGAAFAPGWEARLPTGFDLACVATVAGDRLSAQLFEALAGRCKQVSIARTQASLADLRIAYPQPQRLGVDRFLALLATRARAQRAALVVGVGTALTIDLLDATGQHLGGRIAPSPALMRAALHARAPALPEHGGVYREFGKDTDDALASGCEGAALGLVGRSLDEATRLLAGAAPDLLLHGGGAPALLPRLPTAVHAPALVMQGLAQWARIVGA